MTKAQIISDIQAQLLQGSPSDDSQLEWDQIAFWVGYELNRLVAAECNQAIKAGKQIPAVYKQLAALEVAVVEDSHEEDRIYVLLDDEVLTLNDDAGVILVETEDGDEIPRVSLERFASIKKMRYAKPTLSRPIYYRRGEKIFLLGFTEVDIPFEKVHVYYVPRQDVYAMADTDEVLISDAIRSTLIDVVVQRGKLQLYGTQVDMNNDGVDGKQIQYHTAIANPNSQPEAE
jgi:hypothetical protein